MTNLVKFHAFPTTKSVFNGLLDEFMFRGLADTVGSDVLSTQPLVNVTESENDYKLQVAAPGFDKKDFSIKVENEHLILEATRETKDEQTQPKIVRREFHFNAFKRSFKLPKTVNQEAITAVYENGLLMVTVPKVEIVKPLPKSIEIQ